MTSRLLRGLRSNAVAILALFIALGGSAYAASKIGPSDIKRDAVKSRHIGRDQVKRSHVAAGAIGSQQIVDGSVGLEDVDQLPRITAENRSGQTFETFEGDPQNDLTPVELDFCEASADVQACGSDGFNDTIDTPGVYAVDAELSWEANPTGDRILQLFVTDPAADSSETVTDVRPAGALPTTNRISTTIENPGSAPILLLAGQSSGADLGLSTEWGQRVTVNYQYLGPLAD